MFSPSIALLEALEKNKKKWRESAALFQLIFIFFMQPLQATRAAAFVNGVKACKGRATTKSGCSSTTRK
jgi:hypothetical protein